MPLSHLELKAAESLRAEMLLSHLELKAAVSLSAEMLLQRSCVGDILNKPLQIHYAK
jgi:hypothetical protein